MTNLDHIIIAASSLDSGVEYVREALGVDIPSGGRHEMMATHNHVMSLDDGVYLEVIALNPDMNPPYNPRWFGLDDPAIRADLQRGPRLLTWAVNSNNLADLCSCSTVPLGKVTEAQRDDLRWLVAISEDGRIPGAGFLPLAIQWLVDFHPSERMQQLGCRFKQLNLFHSRKPWLEECLHSIGADGLVKVMEIPDSEMPYLSCWIEGPNGEVEFKSVHEHG